MSTYCTVMLLLYKDVYYVQSVARFLVYFLVQELPASTRFATAIVRCQLVMYFLRPTVMLGEQFVAYFVQTRELIRCAT